MQNAINSKGDDFDKKSMAECKVSRICLTTQSHTEQLVTMSLDTSSEPLTDAAFLKELLYTHIYIYIEVIFFFLRHTYVREIERDAFEYIQPEYILS